MTPQLDQLIRPARQKLSRFLMDDGKNSPVTRRKSDVTRSNKHRHPDVLIVGDVTIELPITIDAPHADLLQGRWTIGKPRLGGFVTHALRFAHALGAKAHLRTILPDPMLPCFEPFLHEYGIDAELIERAAGPCPVRFQFQCWDAVFTLERPGAVSKLSWPSLVNRNECDIVLVDPTLSEDRQAMIHAMTSWAAKFPSSPFIGAWVNSTWTREELAGVARHDVWVFMDEPNGRTLMQESEEPSSYEHDAALSRALKNIFNFERLVLTCGERGAVMMNGRPMPYHADTCSLKKTESLGCGPALMATTMISKFLGANDETSLSRGVAAASGLIVGLDPPTCVTELDAGRD